MPKEPLRPLLKNNIPEATKIRARQAVYRAIVKGWLSPADETSCLDCRQSNGIEYHHESYDEDRWLDVVPVCRHCHLTRHWGNYTRSSTTRSTSYRQLPPYLPYIEKKRVGIYVPIDLIPLVKDAAEKHGISLSELWCRAAQLWIKTNEEQLEGN